jgi:ubiquinone/menaquinone biosynthesis C-methylase UbiE
MKDETAKAEPLTRRVYGYFAERYASAAPTKPHNALYERPATLSLLGVVKEGMRILDAGCGPGITCEILARQGASVHGIDVTPAMIELSRERCRGLSVELTLADLEEKLSFLADSSFDKVVCSLVLDYVASLPPIFQEFYRVTRPGGILAFSMAHPMREWMDERARGGATYFETTRYGQHFTGFGAPFPFVESYRRPLSDIFNGLVGVGWRIDHVLEPHPLPEMEAVAKSLYAELSLAPFFICVRAQRPAE